LFLAPRAAGPSGMRSLSYTTLFRSPTLPDIIRARPTLRLGKGGKNADSDTVAAVRELQRRLNLKPEHQTGYFGPITDVAVREFQEASGLVVDGIVGPMSWAALGAEYGKQSTVCVSAGSSI